MLLRRSLSAAALLAGPGLAAAVMHYAAPLQAASERSELGTWYRWSARGTGSHPWLLVALVASFVAAWVLVAWQAHASARFARAAARLSVLWALPFAVSAPVLSKDVYAYAAQGAVLAAGGDPYRSAPVTLGTRAAVVRAVDPLWRGTPSPYGPLALRLEELAVLVGGRGEGALVVLRALALVSITGLVLVVRRLTSAEHRDLVTWLALSPLALLQLLAAVHWEAEMAALLVLAWALTRREHHSAAVFVAGLAVDIKATAVVVAVVLLWRSRAWGGALAAAAFSLLLFPPDPLGWLRNLGVSSRAWSPYSPASTLYLLATHVQPERWHLLLICRAVTTAAAAALAVVVVTRRYSPARTCGLLMLAAVAALPTVWPWYVAPVGILLLLDLQRRSWWLSAALTGAASLACLPVDTASAQRVMLLAEAVASAACLGVLVRSSSRHGRRSAVAGSAPAT